MTGRPSLAEIQDPGGPRPHPGGELMPDQRERGQVQIASIIGFAAIMSAAFAAITIIASVAPAGQATTASAPAVPWDAIAALVLLAILIVAIFYLWRDA